MPILSAKQAAIELGIDARTFRKFMRDILDQEDQPGQGNRYHIDSKDIKKLKKKYAAWQRPKAKHNGTSGETIRIPDDEDTIVSDTGWVPEFNELAELTGPDDEPLHREIIELGGVEDPEHPEDWELGLDGPDDEELLDIEAAES